MVFPEPNRPCALLLIVGALLVPGCYLSHQPERPGGAPDAGSIDAGSIDAGSIDAGSIDGGDRDAGPVSCDAVRVAATTALDESTSSLTPRLVALPDEGVGVVYVRRDGSPSRIVYERLDTALRSTTGPVTVASDSFTWAQPARRGDQIAITFGQAGSRQSVLMSVTLDGVPRGGRLVVPLTHPTILSPSRSGYFWLAHALDDPNYLQIAHLSTDGALLHDPVRIVTGRYGSGHGAIARPDARSHVVTYPREGPPGVREGYVNALDETGSLGPERLLGMDGDGAVYPVRRGEELLLVRHSDDALVLERTDFDSLERIDAARFPPIPSRPLAGRVGDRLVIGYALSGNLHIDDYGPDLIPAGGIDVPLPSSTLGPGSSLAEVRGALYLALTLNTGPGSFPWIVRIECVPR